MILHEFWERLSPSAKQLLDALSIATLLGSLISMLPAIASLLTIVWTALRIYQAVLELGDRKRKGRADGQ